MVMLQGKCLSFIETEMNLSIKMKERKLSDGMAGAYTDLYITAVTFQREKFLLKSSYG